MDDIKDIKPPLDIPGDFPWGWLILGVVAVLAGVAVFLILHRRQKRSSAVPVIAQAPSWEKAYARLEQLKIKRLIERPSLKDFYSELSDIIRHYLEERFSLKAPEMTTEEFLESLKTSPVLNDVQQQMLKDFLVTCDMVKFAKHQPTSQQAQRSFDLIKTLISQTHGI